MKDPLGRKTLLFSLYQKLDRRRAAVADDPETAVDCGGRFKGIETLHVLPVRKRFVHRFPPDAIESIRSRQLDVLLRFGFNILRGDILTAAKYGVWSYHHGDNDAYRGGPAHFWEIYEGNPVSGVVLQVLTERLDAGTVLHKGMFASEPGVSLVRNRVRPWWGASTFVIQKLRELHELGWEHLEQRSLPPAPYRGRKAIYTSPSNAEMIRWLAPLALSKPARRAFQRKKTPHWRLAIRAGRVRIDPGEKAPDTSGFRWIESPRGRFYADPFLIEVNGAKWLFFEDFDYGIQRGRIACAEVKDGSLGGIRPALERDYHLSYPCIFRDGDSIFMVPETAASGAVELYRCVRFPDQWRFERDLLLAQAVDTTVMASDGRYWFFVTMEEPHGGATQLWLFHSDSLHGELIRHPASPISTDVRDSRGAGAIVRHGGRLYRPSQDCSRHYGYSFTFNEILELDQRRYREARRATVLPSWSRGLVATHSYSSAGNIEVIDGCVNLPTPRLLAPR